MKITVNGEGKEIPEGLTVSTLLEYLGIHSDRVAIEYNLRVLPRPQWNATLIQPDDRFEIVHFVGGG